jgi:hypothetical protein
MNTDYRTALPGKKRRKSVKIVNKSSFEANFFRQNAPLYRPLGVMSDQPQQVGVATAKKIAVPPDLIHRCAQRATAQPSRNQSEFNHR